MGTAPPVGTHVEPQLFRQVLGHVPTTVTVVTAATGTGPAPAPAAGAPPAPGAARAGWGGGWFVSASRAPPLVGIFIDESSASWPPMSGAGSFTVNVLAHDQQELCARFARSGGDKFTDL